MALPPPQPVYVLRGHAAQVHALEFSPTNIYLLSGDADGYVVCWSLATKRATASWRAHTNAVLGLAWWSQDIIITHGRDSQLHMWRLTPDLNTILPVDRIPNPDLPVGKMPTLFHSMTVNTLNFCAFTWTLYHHENTSDNVFLLALPHTLSSEAIDIFEIKIQSIEASNPLVDAVRRSTIPAPNLNNPKTGLTMCLSFLDSKDLLAGYESGHTIVYSQDTASIDDDAHQKGNANHNPDRKIWHFIPSYISRPHSQPILSIRGVPNQELFITTAADSKVVTHRIRGSLDGATAVTESTALHILDSKHSGQQGLSIRDDGRVMATSGWDGKGRVYRAPTEQPASTEKEIVPPREIAVLKWHKEGCYCTAFAHVQPNQTVPRTEDRLADTSEPEIRENASSMIQIRAGQGMTETTAQRRDRRAKSTHWLALGSKDGKISLWDIV